MIRTSIPAMAKIDACLTMERVRFILDLTFYKLHYNINFHKIKKDKNFISFSYWNDKIILEIVISINNYFKGIENEKDYIYIFDDCFYYSIYYWYFT